MTAVLSQRQRDLLGSIKSGGLLLEESDAREAAGPLKRMGLLEIERTDEGDKATLTDEGKAAIKSAPSKAEQAGGPPDPEPGAGVIPAEAEGQTSAGT